MNLLTDYTVIDGVKFKRVKPMAFQFKCILPSKDIPQEFVSRVVMDFIQNNHIRVNEKAYGWVENQLMVANDAGPWKQTTMEELYKELVEHYNGV